MCKLCGVFVFLGLLTISSRSASAHDASFVFTTTSLTPYTRAYLGNGFFSMVTEPVGTRPTESYMIKIYDHTVDDVPRIAALPAWNEINFFDGARWLNDAAPDDGSVASYQQILNTYDGSLLTSYEWVDGKRRTAVETLAFVSRANPNLTAIRFTVVPRFSGTVKVLLPIRPWAAPSRLPVARLENLPHDAGGNAPDVRYSGHMLVEDRHVRSSAAGGLISVVSRVEGRSAVVAEVVRAAWPNYLKQVAVRRITSDYLAGLEVSFQATAGTRFVFYKYVGIVPSFSSDTPAETAGRVAASAWARGFQAIFQEHTAAWHELGKTDILVFVGSSAKSQRHYT